MKRIGRIVVFLALVLSASAFAQGVELTASSSRTSVDLNEPFRVTYTTNSRKGEIEPPNFKKFIVVNGPFQSSQTQIINGRVSSQRSITYEIVAQEEGDFTLPAASIMADGRLIESNELKISVRAGTKRKNKLSQKAKESFNVSILASKKSVYVGEPVVLKFRATLFDPVRDLSILQAPNFENVLQKQLEFKQQSQREVIGNKVATVLDFDKRLILPNKPGILGGQELKISGQVQVPTGRRDFFNMPLTKFVPEVATAKIPAVKIKPLPSGAPSSFDGGVGALKLIREISRYEVSGDESVTIKLRIEGSGNLNTLEVPELDKPEGFDVYDPKYNESIRYSERGIRGFKEYEYLLVPQYRGEFILPQMSWSYFNTTTEKYETITIDADTLVVSNPDLSGVEQSSIPSTIKREVGTIDDDIRYLQQTDFKPYQQIQLKRWTVILFGILGLFWLWQLMPQSEKVAANMNWKKSHLKQVQKAFNNDEGQRYGIMLNALEFALVKNDLNLESVTIKSLEETFSPELAGEISALIEQCNMAQYAPTAHSDDVENLKNFVSVWEKI